MTTTPVGQYSSERHPRRTIYKEELVFTGTNSQWITEAEEFRSGFLVASRLLTELEELKLGGEVLTPAGVALSAYQPFDKNGEWPVPLRAFPFRDMKNLNTHIMAGLPFRITLVDGSTLPPGVSIFIVCKC